MMANDPHNPGEAQTSGVGASSDDCGWSECPAGALTGLAGRLRAEDQRRQQADAIKTFGAVAVGVALLVVGVGLLRGEQHSPMGCNECLANFDTFQRHLTGQESMDEVTLARMEEHLGACEPCQQHFEMQHPGLLEELGQTRVTQPPLALLPLGR